ncbi:MAG: hypothetical protein CMO80_18380 [Verrucomicrobiales bacterium]|nr:hypothetical protein [Verrucomicrobiales bacterium]
MVGMNIVLFASGRISLSIGLLTSAWALYLFFGEKGRSVLSKDYATIVAQAPNLDQRASWAARLVIGVIFTPVSFSFHVGWILQTPERIKGG